MQSGFQAEFVPAVPDSEIRARISRLQQAMVKSGLDAALVVQPVDQYYYSGTAQKAYLYIPARAKPLLLVRRDVYRASMESPLDVVPLERAPDLPRAVESFCGGLPRTCGLEFDILPVREYIYYQRLLPATEFRDVSRIILGQRAVKSDWEVDRMKATGLVSKKAFASLCRSLEPGWSELQAAAAIESAARALGHQGKLRIRHFKSEGYPGHLLSGANGTVAGALDSPATGRGPCAAFPFGAGFRRIGVAEPLMVDFSCVVDGYHMDETRMFALERVPAAVRQATMASMEIYRRLLEFLRPGITCGSVFEKAVSIAAEIGWQDEFLGLPGQKVKFVGHGIGLELVEPPLLAKGRNEVLEAGMVFAIEPKLVVKEGFIAGIENVVCLTEKGAVEVSRTPLEIYVCKAGSDRSFLAAT